MTRRSSSLESILSDGIHALGLTVPEPAVGRLLDYRAELQKWNAAYNLTAVRDPAEMVTRHLLDSLAVLPAMPLPAAAGTPGPRVLDVGAGAGLPGLVLAIVRPDLRVTVLDSNGKKARFMRHAVRALQLDNAEVAEARVEQWQAQPYQAIVSRAFSALADFVGSTAHLLADGGQWLAMKGKLDASELAAVPAAVDIREIRRLRVPGLDEDRHLVIAAPKT